MAYAWPGLNSDGLYLGAALSGAGARSMNAVHCARMVSNVSMSSCCTPRPSGGNSMRVYDLLPLSGSGFRMR
jgi:hypothetical protein